MKVLVVGPSTTKSKGGMATVISNISNSKELNKKYNIDIFPSYIDGNILIRILYSIISYLKYLIVLNSADIVHIHMASRGSTWRKWYYIKSAKRRGKRVLLHIHGAGYKEFYEKGCTAEKKNKICNLLDIVDEVIVLSEEWKEFFAKLCDNDKINVLYNAVPIPKFRRKKYNDHNILFLGRLGQRKGIYDLLEAIPKVLEKIPDAKFFIGGDGDIEICQKICNDKGIENSVSILGWISAVEREKYFKLCSTYILPSYNEGMPMSVLEAMSWECSVVTTPVGGIPQVINNKKNGILVNPGNVKEISNTLIDIITAYNKKEYLSKKAKKTIEMKFSIDTWCMRLSELYGS